MALIAPRRDSRALAYAVVAAVSLGLGLLTGEPEPTAVAAAFTAVLMIGLWRASPVDVAPTVQIESRRVLEGDRVRVTLDVAHPDAHHVELTLVKPSTGLGETTYERERITADHTRVEIEVETQEWGRHDLGRLVIRTEVDGSLCTWEHDVTDLGKVTVLPRPARLTSLLSPTATQASAGGHPSKAFLGDGAEFIDIRPYLPGDRVRDINWKATARRGTPHINRRRPERGGEVVLVLDATSDGWQQSNVGSALLQRSGQAVWALARAHLAAQDRVGLLTQQSDGIDWLPPEGGMRARYRVLETLLGANESGQRRLKRSSINRHDIPPPALVIGISALSNNLTLRSLAALRASGRTVGVLAIDAAMILHETEELDAATLRLASMMFDAHVAYVRRLGLPVVSWRPGEDLDRAVTRLAALTKRSLRVGGIA